MQLDLEGVEPLSDEERISRWLADQTEETEDVFEAALFLRDHNSRGDRAARWLTVRQVQAPFDTEWGWLITGGSEAVWLYDEAERAFVSGLFLASLLCAHAACERALAGCLQVYEDRLDRRWRRWGLGPLTRTALELGLIDPPLGARLDQVTELRKVSAHYKPPLMPNSVHMRALTQLPDDFGLSDEDALDEILYEDALLALEVATELLRGDQGFARVRMWS
jgi:hypothetical protein